MTTENTTPTESTATDQSDSWDDTPSTDVAQDPQDTPPKEDGKEQPKQPTKKEKRWLTAKIDGKEERIDEETLLRDYQKFKAADQKFQEAAKIRQSTEQFLKALQEDPESVLSDPRITLDRKKLAEKWILQQIHEELTPQDPKDQKLKEYEAELAKYKQKEDDEVKTQQEQEYQKVVEAKRQELSNTFSEAMKKSPLSKNPETAAATLREMALYYRAAKQQGHSPTPDEIAQHVEQKYFKGLYELANTLEGEDLVAFLGDQLVKKIRKYDLSKLSKLTSQKVDAAPDDWAPSKADSNKRMTPADAKEMVRRKLQL
jgi:hypothetical protein